MPIPMYDVDRGAEIWRDGLGGTEDEAARAARTALVAVKSARAAGCPDESIPGAVFEALAVIPELSDIHNAELDHVMAVIGRLVTDLEEQRTEAVELHRAYVAALADFHEGILPTDLVAAVAARDEHRCRFCGRGVLWDADPDNYRRGFCTLADPHGDPVEDNVVVTCAGCNRARVGRFAHHIELGRPFSDRKLAHQIYPHPDEGTTQPLDEAIRYHYARTIGANTWLDDGTLDHPAFIDRINHLCYARHIALLYDAFGQGLTGQDALDWVEPRAWDETGEIVWDRAVHHGIDPDAIRPYPIDEGGRYYSRILQAMAREVAQVNRANGWYEEDRSFGDDVALLHSEASEALEAFRDYGYGDATADIDHDRCRAKGWAGPCPSPQCPPVKPEGVGSELADVLIRLLDTAERRGVDLGAEYVRKLAYNRTRGHRHGGKRL